MESPLVVLVVAIALDLFRGEFPRAIHPVVWMGKSISLLERCSPKRGVRGPLVVGLLIALAVPAVFAWASALVVDLASSWPMLGFAVSVALLKSTFSIRALGQVACVVRDKLRDGEIAKARLHLHALCGRDPSSLDSPRLVSATIESVAENASDSFVAPLLYYALLGIPGAVAYRAVNTLDAMIGYHGNYEYLGKGAARLDDLLNWLPARLTAGLLLLAGVFAGKDIGRGWRVLGRDGKRTESPNAGRPMATMAGLLRIQLEKIGHYRLGDPIEVLTVEKIDEAWGLCLIAAALGVGVFVAIHGMLNAYG